MSDSVRPHRWQPTRLLCPWDSLGKNTGVGCHFLLKCTKVKSESEVTQSCPTLREPMDCSPPGFSVHGIFQARVLEWVAIAFFITSHNYLFCVCGGNIKIYSLCNFQVCDTVLLIIVQMLCIVYCIHMQYNAIALHCIPRTYSLYSWKFVIFDQHVPSSPGLQPW